MYLKPGDPVLWDGRVGTVLRVVDMGHHEHYARVSIHALGLPYWVNFRYLERNNPLDVLQKFR
jgi:hypothetical protein